jgi:hypothetical protein
LQYISLPHLSARKPQVQIGIVRVSKALPTVSTKLLQSTTFATKMARFLALLSANLLLIAGANAQFQFFEQMFNQGGQQQHHQAPQNVPSDSNWYQENYNAGLCTKFLSSYVGPITDIVHSPLLELPLPRHPSMRALPTPLPMPAPDFRGEI